MNKPTVYDCSIIELPKIENRSGNITPIHGNVNVPFDIKRVFYSYDIPGGGKPEERMPTKSVTSF